MNTQEKIKEQVTTHPVVFYMKGLRVPHNAGSRPMRSKFSMPVG